MNIAEATFFVNKKIVVFTSGFFVVMGGLKYISSGWVNFEAHFGRASCEYSFAFHKIEIEITPFTASGVFLLKLSSIYYAVSVTSAENWVSLFNS